MLSTMRLRSGTHRVDVESHWAALYGIHSGLTAGQRSLQRVVGGVDCCFACWVLKGEVGVGKAIRLRRHEKKKIKWQRRVFAHFHKKKPKQLRETNETPEEVELRFLQIICDDSFLSLMWHDCAAETPNV